MGEKKKRNKKEEFKKRKEKEGMKKKRQIHLLTSWQPQHEQDDADAWLHEHCA